VPEGPPAGRPFRLSVPVGARHRARHPQKRHMRFPFGIWRQMGSACGFKRPRRGWLADSPTESGEPVGQTWASSGSRAGSSVAAGLRSPLIATVAIRPASAMPVTTASAGW